MFILPIDNNLAQEQIKAIGVHQASIGIMTAKSEIMPLKIAKVRTPAANILKQEMLAAGGDCVVNAACVTCSGEHTDVLLLGTVKHYKMLIHKLAQMNYFGLGKINSLLQEYLLPKTLHTVLPSGRVVLYDSMQVMGIVNVTEDSFFEPSRKHDIVAVLDTVEQMLADGAQIIDVGGESTRPGFTPVPAEIEIKRVVPVVAAIKERFGAKAIVSVDTYKAQTAKYALEAGADLINDISGCADVQMREVLLNASAPVVVMHMFKHERENNAAGTDIVQNVAQSLYERTESMLAEGFSHDKIIIDIGIGFGKTQAENLRLLKYLKAFKGLGYPHLLGVSRKRTIGNALGIESAAERMSGTLAVTAKASNDGVDIIRVHDVKENAQIIKMSEAIKNV